MLRANPDTVLSDFELFGFLFESLCTRDMRVYAQANDGDVFHYRDKSELEVDLIVRLRDGRWGAIGCQKKLVVSCKLDEVSKLTPEYPGWMIDFMSADRQA